MPAVDEPELMTLAAATAARAGWLAVPAVDLALADHVVATLPALTGAFAAVREQATRLVAEREDLWAPLALRLGEWVTQRKLADEEASKVAEVSQALDWLKRNSADLRNQRMAPLAGRARHIWATLRQESNVGLDAIRLEGEATRPDLRADPGDLVEEPLQIRPRRHPVEPSVRRDLTIGQEIQRHDHRP